MRTLLILFVIAAPVFAQSPGAQSKDSSLAHLRLGETLFTQHDFQGAAIEFSRALKADGQPAWTLVWSHVNLGKTFDAIGVRDRAVHEYELALETKDNTFGALDFANMFIPKAPPILKMSLPDDNDDSFTGPAVLSRVEPSYSAEALLARLEGMVLVAASVAPDGAITDLRILKSLGLGLDEAALEAVRQWKFAPATAKNQPVAAVTPVDIHFHLPAHLPGWHVKQIAFTKPDAMKRPILKRAVPFEPGKMNPELAEEAVIDAAISRTPNATISMEIDTLGTPGKFQVNAASLPAWGDDAVHAISEWRFSPGPIPVPCVIELGWFAPNEFPPNE